jgi:hypothetical protein
MNSISYRKNLTAQKSVNRRAVPHTRQEFSSNSPDAPAPRGAAFPSPNETQSLRQALKHLESKEINMHPAMAIYIWSMSMSRAWQSSLWDPSAFIPQSPPTPKRSETSSQAAAESRIVLAKSYLHSEIAQNPLPGILLDRLADLYWTERDAELAI